jgi:riboflavin kinase
MRYLYLAPDIISMDSVLLLLLKRGAHLKPVRLTTTEVGSLTGMSQQNASRKLKILEQEGQIQRSKEGLRLTKKAYDELAAIYSELRNAFEGGHIAIEGIITKGLGEGGYYVSMKGYRRQIAEKLGFDPYPGTLNIRIDDEDGWKKQHLLQLEPIIIPGFKDNDRTYGDLFAYPCKLGKQDCAIIVPLRTHHGPEIIELVSPVDIKKELHKKDGDRVRVMI